MAITKVDYTTFTKQDPNSHLTVTKYHLDFDAYTNEDCWLVGDYGVGYFSNFVHTVDVKVSHFYPTNIGYVWMLSNKVDDAWGLQLGGESTVGISFIYSTTAKICLSETVEKQIFRSCYDLFDVNFWLSLKIIKQGDSLKCEIYVEDAATGEKILLKTLSLTLHADHVFRYIFGCNTANIAVETHCTLEIENLILEREKKIVTFNSMPSSATVKVV